MAQKDKKVNLTKGEEEVMQMLWSLGKGSVNDILERYTEDKPKYTTVATFLKLLEDKGYVGHLSQGKTNVYYPLVEKEEYAGTIADNVVANFFGGSFMQMVSHFSKENGRMIFCYEEDAYAYVGSVYGGAVLYSAY